MQSKERLFPRGSIPSVPSPPPSLLINLKTLQRYPWHQAQDKAWNTDQQPTTRHEMVETTTTWHETVQKPTTQHETDQQPTTRLEAALPPTTPHNTIRYINPRHGTRRCSIPRHGTWLSKHPRHDTRRPTNPRNGKDEPAADYTIRDAPTHDTAQVAATNDGTRGCINPQKKNKPDQQPTPRHESLQQHMKW